MVVSGIVVLDSVVVEGTVVVVVSGIVVLDSVVVEGTVVVASVVVVVSWMLSVVWVSPSDSRSSCICSSFRRTGVEGGRLFITSVAKPLVRFTY